jgi:hypothetical protein
MLETAQTPLLEGLSFLPGSIWRYRFPILRIIQRDSDLLRAKRADVQADPQMVCRNIIQASLDSAILCFRRSHGWGEHHDPETYHPFSCKLLRVSVPLRNLWNRLSRPKELTFAVVHAIDIAEAHILAMKMESGDLAPTAHRYRREPL